MFRGLLTLLLLLCLTIQESTASYLYVNAHLQADTVDEQGKRSAFLFVDVLKHDSMADGTQLDVIIGSAYVSVNGFKSSATSDCAKVVLGNAVFYTAKTSSKCVSEWLSYPGMDSLLMASLKQGASQKVSNQDWIRVESGAGYISISVNSKARDLDGSMLDIYNAAGRLMDAHHRLQGQTNSQWYTMSSAGFPAGSYKAVLRKEDGQILESVFSIR